MAKATVNAAKEKIGAAKALELLAGIDTIVVIKGKKIDRLELKKNRPDDAAILALIIGPTGNLRAPTAKVGKTMLVGFNDEAYAKVLG